MTREQAINYLICRGITEYQVSEIVRALTYKPRDCANCKHYIVKDTRTNWGSQETTKIYGCERWECEYEPTTKNDLGVDCISRQAVIDLMMQKWGENFSGDDAMQESIDAIRVMPSVTPQEPILGKIRAEIEGLTYYWCETNPKNVIDDVLEIIDKYKAETEKTDGTNKQA